jgi:ArsR family transcriptional regulator
MTVSDQMSETDLARIFHALSDPRRLAILAVLQEGECCVCDLAERVDAGQSLLSFHLKALREAGLVTDRKDGRWVHYSVNHALLVGAGDYLAGLVIDARLGRGHMCCRHG